MTGSVGDKAIVGSAAIASEDSNTVYTLADVLEREFSELHQEVTDETLAQDRTGATQANQQQPLEDPSLSPADHQTRDQAIEYTEIGKIPSRHLCLSGGEGAASKSAPGTNGRQRRSQ
jgi:hypothetical protein